MKDYDAIFERLCASKGWIPSLSLFRPINILIADLEEWDAAHPVKTYAQDFFEKFPNATRDDAKIPKSCWGCIYPKERLCPKVNGVRVYDCTVCWNRPMADEQNAKP
jgi:hypothetical protein